MSKARARSAAGGLSSIQNLSPSGLVPFFASVGVDTDGDAVFMWQGVDGTEDRTQTRARSAAGVLTPVQTLAVGFVAEPNLAVDEKGRSVYSWQRTTAKGNQIQARARSAGGTLSDVQTISGAGAFNSVLAPAGDLGAVFAWQRADATNQRIEGAVGRPS